MEITPETPSTTIALTRARASELTSEGNLVKLAIAISIIGVIGLIAVVYLITRRG